MLVPQLLYETLLPRWLAGWQLLDKVARGTDGTMWSPWPHAHCCTSFAIK